MLIFAALDPAKLYVSFSKAPKWKVLQWRAPSATTVTCFYSNDVNVMGIENRLEKTPDAATCNLANNYNHKLFCALYL